MTLQFGRVFNDFLKKPLIILLLHPNQLFNLTALCFILIDYWAGPKNSGHKKVADCVEY